MNKILLSMTASLILMACGHNSTEGQANDQASATIETMDTCWKQNATALDGVKVEVTSEGGVKVVWTDWDKFMKFNTVALSNETYPFDAPMTEQEIIGLAGKVKGLAILGHPMSPYVYMLLEDNSVQLYSLSKMCQTWDFYAGRIVAHNVTTIKEELRDFEVVVIESADGTKTTDEEFLVEEQDLYSYIDNADGMKIERLVVGVDGSMAYYYCTGCVEAINKEYHGTITSFKNNGDTLQGDFEYVLDTQIDEQDMTSAKKVDIKGVFSVKSNDELDGYYTITPKSGLNMAAYNNEKLGEVRDMLIKASFLEFTGQ